MENVVTVKTLEKLLCQRGKNYLLYCSWLRRWLLDRLYSWLLWRKEDKRLRRSIKLGFEREIRRQHELLQQNMRRVEDTEASQPMTDGGEEDGRKTTVEGEEQETLDNLEDIDKQLRALGGEDIGDGYIEPVDYNASQEQDSFENLVRKAERGELDTKSLDMYRRSDRNKGKEDCNIEELAKEGF